MLYTHFQKIDNRKVQILKFGVHSLLCDLNVVLSKSLQNYRLVDLYLGQLFYS